MKCPFCSKEIERLAVHIKQEHPKKLKFLEKTKPKLYLRLQKELEILEMKKKKDPNLLILKTLGKTHYFKHHCVHCGNCCHLWEIEIQPEDVEKWALEERIELLKGLQIYPQSISIMNLGLIQRVAEIYVNEIDLGSITFVRKLYDRDQLDKDRLIQEIVTKENIELNEDLRNRLSSILDIQAEMIGYYIAGDVEEISEKIVENVRNLRSFILENHEYQGEPIVDKWGDPIEDSTLPYLKQQLPELFDETYGVLKGKIPHWLLGINYGPRAILSPKSFETVAEGWKHGLSYYLIYELKGGCGFLENNRCNIHTYKPIACREFPYNRRTLDYKADKQFLESCKGLKKIL